MKIRYKYWVFFSLLCLLACRGGKGEVTKYEEPEFKDTINYFPEFPELTKDYIIATRASASRFYRSYIKEDRFSGTFLVAKNGRIIYERTTGFFNHEKKIKLSREHPIHVASISKVATAIQILRLCDEGLIDLEADVRTYLPDLPYHGITVRMLLNHRSGLPYYGYFSYSTWDTKKKLTNSDILQLLKKHKFRLAFDPGKKFTYCNTNYVLLALIAEKVTGVEFPKLMKERIFDPLGMSNTFIMDQRINTDTVSQSYNSKYKLQRFTFLDAVYGDKNMYTTARDLLKLDKATYSHKFLSDSLRKQMFRGYSYERRGKINYGLGIRIFEFPGQESYYFHTGWWHGNTGCYATLRSDTMCVIAISNKYTHTVYRIRNMAPNFGKFPGNLEFE